jgi:hypothetical protein
MSDPTAAAAAAAWQERRAAMRQKRAANRAASALALGAEAIPFVAHNGGAHLVVAEVWDFYPGTGLFQHRHVPTRGRGVRALIRHVKESPR